MSVTDDPPRSPTRSRAAKDDPELGLTPSFRTPTPEPEEPEPTGMPPVLSNRGPRPRMGLRGLVGGGGSPDSDPTGQGAGTPTLTSSAPGARDRPEVKPLTVAETTTVTIALLGAAAAGVAALVRWRMRRKLRRPTETETKDIATPLARILQRRAGDLLALFGDDIWDGLAAAAATGAYIGAGPLTGPLDNADPGIPPDLQEHPE